MAAVFKVSNVVRLPEDPLNLKKQSPEVILREMCLKIVDDANAYPETKKQIRKLGADETFIQQEILTRKQNESITAPSIESDREVAKSWFTNRYEHIKDMRLIEGWVADNSTGVQLFMKDLVKAVGAATGSSIDVTAIFRAKKSEMSKAKSTK